MLDSPLVRRLIDLAIEEDLSGGDLTSELSIDHSVTATAEFLSRESLIVCGLPVAAKVIEKLAPNATITSDLSDGDEVEGDRVLLTAKGKAGELLSLERTTLNFLQRMSGVATGVRAIVSNIPSNITLLDTRKTIPGWRLLDKYAVRIGGGKESPAELEHHDYD